jgi:hypothetical protein
MPAYAPSPRVRRRLVAVVAYAAALTAVTGTGAGADGPSASAAVSASRPILWGDIGNTKRQILAREAAFGRKLTLYRIYKSWDQGVDGDMRWARDGGRIPLLSVRAEAGGRPLPWRSFAAATPGSTRYGQIQRWGRELAAYRRPLYVAFHHEPDTKHSVANGTAADFVAAHRKVMAIWRAVGATNVRRTVVLTAWGFKLPLSSPKAAPHFYPGDAHVDVVAADGYNWYSCWDTGWRELEGIIEGFRQWGRAHPTRKLMLAEYGSTEDPAQPGRKAQWIRNAAALFKKAGYGQFIGLTGWGDSLPGAKCGFNMDTSRSARRAYADMGAMAKYGARSAL